MLRRRFIKGSAIVGAAATAPSWLRAASGMWSDGGERKVAQVLECQRTMVQNVPVLRGFAGDHTDLVSPFVMLDEFGPLQIDPGTLGMDIKAHPHAGVAPTTYLLSGSGRHTDSLDNDLIYREGQFMVFSSGRGAVHEEVSSMEIRRDGGVVHGFQIWLNLPADQKFSTPLTTLRDKTDFPIVETEDYRIKVVMGEAFGAASPTALHSPAFYHHVQLKAGARLDLPVDPRHNAFLHMINGKLEVEGQRELAKQQLALYHRGGDVLRFYSEVGAEFLVLGGQPLDEPVVSYGPFVMNNRAQIQRCIADYQAGRMGEL
jgi:quercetin 2,3-dioxygenase